MSSNQLNAGQSHGQAKATAEDWTQSAENTAHRAADKMSDSPGQAQQRKEEASGFIQQTGESVVHMAQGTIDGMKNTLGFNEKKGGN